MKSDLHLKKKSQGTQSVVSHTQNCEKSDANGKKSQIMRCEIYSDLFAHIHSRDLLVL